MKRERRRKASGAPGGRRFALRTGRAGWLFLAATVVPGLILAALAFRAISREEAYVEKQLRDALSAETVSVASLVTAQLRAAEQELASTMPDARPGVDARRLAQWGERSALVQVPFLLSPDFRVDWPPPQAPAAEERALLEEHGEFLENREAVASYKSVAEAYLSDILPAKPAKPSAGSTSPATAPVAADSPALVQQAAGRLELDESVRKKVYAQAREEGQELLQRNVVPLGSPAGAAEPSRFITEYLTVDQITASLTQGLIPRVVDERLHLLFWRRLPSGAIAGCVVRLEEVRRRLVAALPPVQTRSRLLTLLDERGEPLLWPEPAAEAPAGGQADPRRPFVTREVSELLPRWEAAAYLTDPALFARRVRLTRTLLALLVSILFVTIAASGTVLLRRVRAEVALARQRTSFVAHVSHQLKTPLTSIRLYADMLRDGRVPDAQRRRGYLQTLSTEAERLTGLVNDVLDFARLEQGRRRYRLRELDVAKLAAEVLESQRARLQAAGFEVGFVGSAGCSVRGDEEALRQVLLNLISNAEKYSGARREVRVEVECPAALPRRTARRGASDRRGRRGPGGVRIRVLDRGRGVPAREARLIFDEFYRADASLTARGQGAGLGLSIARRIVEAHGGMIRCQPREGGGSVFEILLPRKG